MVIYKVLVYENEAAMVLQTLHAQIEYYWYYTEPSQKCNNNARNIPFVDANYVSNNALFVQ